MVANNIQTPSDQVTNGNFIHEPALNVNLQKGAAKILRRRLFG